MSSCRCCCGTGAPARGARLVYASSAATYGDGSAGFADDMAALSALRPLNLYGWSKHAFDLQVARILAAGRLRPPQWAGLKFFNVYGPNEYHKGSMISVVKVKYDEVAAGRAPRLFRSDQAELADGEQRRDFIWVGDVVDVLLWLLDTPEASGIFNVGTGQARSYRDLARAVCAAAGRARSGRVHRHAGGVARPVPDPSPKRRCTGCAPPAIRRRSRRWTRGCAATCRTSSAPLPLTCEIVTHEPVTCELGVSDPLLFPQFDPVLIRIGPLAIRWYALAYISSLVIGWRWCAGSPPARRRWPTIRRWTIS